MAKIRVAAFLTHRITNTLKNYFMMKQGCLISYHLHVNHENKRKLSICGFINACDYHQVAVSCVRQKNCRTNISKHQN